MYLEYYRLQAEPFLLTPDHRFYYDSDVHSQAMAHLIYGINRGEGFIVITGEVGAGKTTLLKQLCACLDDRRIVAAHVVTTLVTGQDLLRLVMAAFGMTDIPSEKGAMLLRLQSFFEYWHRKGRRMLLIVDEAQNLSISTLEELRMLSNFQIGSTAPFQTFLVGQPQFRNILANPELEQLRQRVITSYHLGPMDRDEVGKYIPHRLLKAGWLNDPSFDKEALDAIFRHTGGVPRRINALASRLLLYGFLEKLHHFSAEDVEKVAADLAAEANLPAMPAPEAPVPIARPAAEPPAAEAELSERLERIERRLSHQDEHMVSAVSALRDFLKLAISDRERNSISG
jgi:putative secretion ATPase (PEP-CTERM system associated)